MSNSQAVIGLLVLLTIGVWALPTSGAASLRGRCEIVGWVAGPNGDAEPGATVVLRNTSSKQSREVVTGEDGRFHFPRCAAGRYVIEAHDEGAGSGSVLCDVREADVCTLRVSLGTRR